MRFQVIKLIVLIILSLQVNAQSFSDTTISVFGNSNYTCPTKRSILKPQLSEVYTYASTASENNSTNPSR